MDLVTTVVALRRWAVGSLLGNMGIVVTGGLVRVTGSGLGCSTWPQCEPGSYIPHPAADTHTFVEFGNRLLTFVLVAIAIGTFVAAWKARDAGGNPRPAVRVLALVAALGIPAQAVIGGLSVLTQLNPWVVGLHMIASVVMIVVCVALVHRVYDLQPAASSSLVIWLARAVFALGMLVVVLGVVVTGAGPNSGDGGAERNGLDLETVAKIHAWGVWLTLFCLAVLLCLARRSAPVFRAGLVVGVVSLLQGAVGYAQYFLGNPPALVAWHMAGAALFTAAIAHLWLASRPSGAVRTADRRDATTATA